MKKLHTLSPLVVGLLALSAAAIAVVRPKVVASHEKVSEQSDIYPYPPAEQMPVFSLGYDAAAADLLWANALVLQGIRLAEKRKFEHGAKYFDAIFTLEPTYRRPYIMLDSVLAFGAKGSNADDIREIRKLYERGLKARPTDAELYLQAGNFMAYIAPSVLPKEEQDAWRLEGAKLLVRASELGSTSMSVEWHTLSGAALLSRAGEREAAIAFLERKYELTEDAELREDIYRKLVGLKGQEAAERAKNTAEVFEQVWRDELPFVSRAMILLLGPQVDVLACAGSGQSSKPACARDWKSWTDRSTLAAR